MGVLTSLPATSQPLVCSSDTGAMRKPRQNGAVRQFVGPRGESIATSDARVASDGKRWPHGFQGIRAAVSHRIHFVVVKR